MNFETRQRCGTCPPSKWGSRATTAGANNWSTCWHWSLSSFLQRLLTPLEYQPPVISRSGGHVVPRWKPPDVMVRVSFLFPCWCLDIVKIDKTAVFIFQLGGGLAALFGGLNPPNPPCGDGTVCETWKSIAVPWSTWLPNNCREAFVHFGQVYLVCLIFVKKLPSLGKVD